MRIPSNALPVLKKSLSGDLKPSERGVWRLKCVCEKYQRVSCPLEGRNPVPLCPVKFFKAMLDVVLPPLDDQLASLEISKSNDVGRSDVVFINVRRRHNIFVDLHCGIRECGSMMGDHLLDGLPQLGKASVVLRRSACSSSQRTLAAVVDIAQHKCGDRLRRNITPRSALWEPCLFQKGKYTVNT